MGFESTPYRPFGKKDRDVALKDAVDAITQDRLEDIPDEETFRNARVQYIRKQMESGRREKYLEQLFGELEKKWKAAQVAKDKKKLEAGKLVPDQPRQRPDIMDEETFNSIFGDLSSIKEDEEKNHFPETENVPLIPYDETEEGSQKDERQDEELTKNEVVSVKISLPNDDGGEDREFIIMGRVFKSSSQAGDNSTIIKYLGGLSKADEETAIQNKFIRKGYIKVSNSLITSLKRGLKEEVFVEGETGISPRESLEIVGQEGYFRAFGVGKNGSPEKPTIIVISEKALLRGPQLEDELEVPITNVSKVKK